MNLKKIYLFFALVFVALLFFNEFLIYYFTLYWCKWPAELKPVNGNQPVRALLLADVHLLGPYHGHWFDKLRREWQMHRTFQTALTLFNPEIVFILGDLFDEGQWVNSIQFKEYVLRFNRLFRTTLETTIYGVVGNHDVGFHYKMHPYLLDRFDFVYKNKNASGNSLLTIRNVHFVLINSMAMEQDGCDFCEKAKMNLIKISERLKCTNGTGSCVGIQKLKTYSQPIILQHFPTYRKSDEFCTEHDSSEIEPFRQKWEVLSKESTALLGNLLRPRVVFSGHSHNYCKLMNTLHVVEYTIPSFSWRNKNNPRFLLTEFTSIDYAVSVCEMPLESTVISIYWLGFLFSSLSFIFWEKIKIKSFQRKHR